MDRKTVLSINLSLNHQENIVFSKEITPPFEFKGIDLVDSYVGALAGGVSDFAYIEKLKIRKDYARLLAAEITELIMDVLQSKDTFNGYVVEKGSPEEKALKNLRNYV